MTPSLTDHLRKIKDENLSVAVAIEGGGLRGVVSATVVSIFQDFDLFSNIKAISGTSSGAINGAYFLRRDTDSLLALYEKMASSDFIQPWKWPNAMNLSFLFDQQMTQTFPLDWESLLDHSTDFFISVTDVKSGAGEFLKAQDCESADELKKLVRASASAPLFSTNQEGLRGRVYNDGHVASAIPVSCFKEQSFDQILCLLTRKKGYRKKTKLPGRVLSRMALRKYSSSYREEFNRSDSVYNRQLETVFNSPQIIPIALEEEDFIISKTSTNPSDIRKCIESVRSRLLL